MSLLRNLPQSLLTLALTLVPVSGFSLLVGCADSSAVQTDREIGAVASQVAGEDSPMTTRQLLARIESSRTDVAYHGTRRLRMNYRVLGDQRDLEYVERVASDGQGRFGMDIGEIASPAMTVEDEQFFRILQGNRQGFFYRYRDFGIRDLELFQQGYELRHTGQAEICGRDCVVLEVRHRERPKRWYVVAIDPRTGVVMRSEEHVGGSGEIVTSIEFESFEEGLPQDADDFPWYASSFDRKELMMGLKGRSQVGFRILSPTLLPEDYRFERADSLLDEDGRTWVRLVYGDGVENVFFLHSPLSAPRRAPDDQRETVILPTAVGGADETTPAPTGSDRVTVAEVGPWTVVEGTVRGQSIVAMGKVGEDELLQMVQSALETRPGN